MLQDIDQKWVCSVLFDSIQFQKLSCPSKSAFQMKIFFHSTVVGLQIRKIKVLLKTDYFKYLSFRISICIYLHIARHSDGGQIPFTQCSHSHTLSMFN
jgi:hypothetical protein